MAKTTPAPNRPKSTMTAPKEKKKSVSMSKRCNITLPPSRILGIMKTGRTHRTSSLSAVFATAATEAILSRILLACEKTLRPEGTEEIQSAAAAKKRVTPAVLIETIRRSPELSKLLAGFSFLSQDTLGKATEVVLSKQQREKRAAALDAAKKEREAKKATAAATAGA